MRILILYDQLGEQGSPDQTDALVQAQAITQSLEGLGHTSAKLGVSLDLNAARSAIAQHAPDLVFNLIESLAGAGRLIHAVPALLDTMGIPYTGATSEAQFITSHKTLAKALMRCSGIPTPDFVTSEGLRELAAADDTQSVAGRRWVIKSLWEHASVGLDEHSVIEARDARVMLRELESRVHRLGGSAFIEEYIDGREFNIAMLARSGGALPSRGKPQSLPAAEITFDDAVDWGSRPRMVNYACKWNEESFEYLHTERRFDFPDADQPLIQRMTEIAEACWVQFELRGYARVDFRVDLNGQPWVLEVNTNPCLSPDAGFAFALDRAGIEYTEAINRIVQDAVPRRVAKAASHES